ncbi:MAG: SCP2 sterol-binding domain-containing protein [Desulfomonilaceae bacterium]
MAYTNVKETFEKMTTVFDASKARGVNSIVQYIIDGAGGGNWIIELRDGNCRIEEATHDSPNVTITMDAETWLALVNQEISGMAAFMSGKLKATGDVMLAQKIPLIFPL